MQLIPLFIISCKADTCEDIPEIENCLGCESVVIEEA